MTAAARSASTVHPDMIPLFPPRWTEVFGEDDFGIFAEFTVKEARFVWRWIPPGQFLMGSSEDEAGREAECPRHEVTISRGFWMGETPVTQAQWTALMGENQNPSRFKGEQLPVDSVSWRDSTAFADRLSEAISGLRAALPTEAQWEYACRAGTQGAFHVEGSKCTEPKGKDPVLDELGWFDKNSGGETKEVRLKRPNAWGLYDMHGNVWEWCRDAWSNYEPDPEVDPLREGDKWANRVMRGGSWNIPARYCRAAFRSHDDRGYSWSNRGLRLSAGREPGAAEPRGAERPEGG